MKVPEAVMDAAINGHPESWRETIEASVEAALEQLREEQLAYLDGLTFDGTESQDYRDGWADCRGDVELSFSVLGDKEKGQ